MRLELHSRCRKDAVRNRRETRLVSHAKRVPFLRNRADHESVGQTTSSVSCNLDHVHGGPPNCTGVLSTRAELDIKVKQGPDELEECPKTGRNMVPLAESVQPSPISTRPDHMPHILPNRPFGSDVATRNLKEFVSAIVDFATGQLDSEGENGSRYPPMLWHFRGVTSESLDSKF